jgi:hypothetical protein
MVVYQVAGPGRIVSVTAETASGRFQKERTFECPNLDC